MNLRDSGPEQRFCKCVLGVRRTLSVIVVQDCRNYSQIAIVFTEHFCLYLCAQSVRLRLFSRKEQSIV